MPLLRKPEMPAAGDFSTFSVKWPLSRASQTLGVSADQHPDAAGGRCRAQDLDSAAAAESKALPYSPER